MLIKFNWFDLTIFIPIYWTFAKNRCGEKNMECECVFCKAQVKKTDLHRHIIESHDAYFCTRCQGIFASSELYDSHSFQCFESDNENSDTEESGNEDSEKPSGFLSEVTPKLDNCAYLIEQYQNKPVDFYCFCDVIFNSKGQLSKHHKDSECKIRKCACCNRKIASVSSLVTHKCRSQKVNK